MSRKHFISLAQEISLIQDDAARLLAAEAVARAARYHNSAFDINRFLAACGV